MRREYLSGIAKSNRRIAGQRTRGLSYLFFWWSIFAGRAEKEQNRDAMEVTRKLQLKDGKVVARMSSDSAEFGSQFERDLGRRPSMRSVIEPPQPTCTCMDPLVRYCCCPSHRKVL